MKRVRKIKKKGKREFIVFAISQLILGKKSNPYLRLVETPRHTVSLNTVQIPEGTDIVRYTVHEPLHSSTCPPDVNYLPPIRRTNVPLSYAFIFHPLYFHMYMYILDSRRGRGDRDTFLHSRKWRKLAEFALWYPTLRTLEASLYPGSRVLYRNVTRCSSTGGEDRFHKVSRLVSSSDSSRSLQVDPSSHFKRNDTTQRRWEGGMAAGSRIRDNLLLLAFFLRERKRGMKRTRIFHVFAVGIRNANSNSENSSCIFSFLWLMVKNGRKYDNIYAKKNCKDLTIKWYDLAK